MGVGAGEAAGEVGSVEGQGTGLVKSEGFMRKVKLPIILTQLWRAVRKVRWKRK